MDIAHHKPTARIRGIFAEYRVNGVDFGAVIHYLNNTDAILARII